MSADHGSFVVEAGCIDGRTRKPIATLAQRDAGRPVHVDTITEPGMVAPLSRRDKALVARVERAIGISVKHHGSEVIYVAGHAQCAGNPVEDARHQQDVLDAAELVRRLVPRTRGGYSRALIVPTFVAPDSRGRWRARPLRRSA